MPKDNIHHGGVEHREMHNINGALFHAATWQGLEERGRASYGSDGDRPFILSRSAFAGTQRLGALWTGDNKAEWPALKFSVPMCLSLSIAGLPFVGVHLAHSPDFSLGLTVHMPLLANPLLANLYVALGQDGIHQRESKWNLCHGVACSQANGVDARRAM